MVRSDLLIRSPYNFYTVKNSDSTQNYVDRVRIQDSSYVFGGPGRGSGWRQRSLSNIDLTSQSRHSFTSNKQTRDFSSGLYDLYSRIESRKDYQDFYEVDEKQKHSSAESIYDRIEPKNGGGGLAEASASLTASDSCSLRRTRSLAVIREETYNDLQISGVRTRRSQLIPRAKLINRSFFKNRSKHPKPPGEEDSGSGVDTQTSETRESDDYYANLKKLNEIEQLEQLEQQKQQQEQQQQQQPQPIQIWLNDKSDLDSLDSDYFKNSLHQPNEPQQEDQQISSKKSKKDSAKYHQVLEIEVHNQNIRQHCVTADTTTSNSSDLSDSYLTPTNCDDSENEIKISSSFDDITLDKDSDNSAQNSCEISYNTLTLSHHKISESSENSYGKKSKFRQDRKSVVSYDSIYLSSEGSTEHTIVECGPLEDPLPEVYVNKSGEFVDIQIDEYREENKENKPQVNVDSLYSQINKTKPKIISIEPNVNLTSFSDVSTRGTLERLTFISTSSSSASAQQKEFQQIEGKLFSTEPFVGTLIDNNNQYCSLPDASIGISLRASERIDAKLRLSCNSSTTTTTTTTSKTIEDPNHPIYDSISRFGRAHKRLRQRESFEIVVLNPTTIDEQPKEAQSIEVEKNAKVLLQETEKQIDQIKVQLLTKKQKIVEKSAATKANKELDAKTVKQPEAVKLVEIKSAKDVKTAKQPAAVKLVEIKSAKDVNIAKQSASAKFVEIKSAKDVKTAKQSASVKQIVEIKSAKEKQQVEAPIVKESVAKEVTAAVAVKKEISAESTLAKEKLRKQIEQLKAVASVKEKLASVKRQHFEDLKSAAKEKSITATEKLIEEIHFTPVKKEKPIESPGKPFADCVGKKPLIVDELAAKVLNSKNNQQPKKELPPETKSILKAIPPHNKQFRKPSEIKIIVTDASENIVEQITNELLRKSIDINEPPPPKVDNFIAKAVQKIEPKSAKKHIKKAKLRDRFIDPVETLRSEFKANLTDTLRKRIADSRNIFNARPIRVSSEEHIEKLNDTYQIHPSLTYKVKLRDQNIKSTNMPRPQILNVIDGKRNVCSVAPRQAANDLKESTEVHFPQRRCQSIINPEVQQEFQEKVDSVRCYWSKLIEEQDQQQQLDKDEVDAKGNVHTFITSIDNDHKSFVNNNYCNKNRNQQMHDREDFTSFSPSVEIIELDGQKQAAIVKAQNMDTQDFDHIRYKVMKSDTFQKNILTQTRKEAQFDGLLQYLHNYSFQELLANNNVVIIEPIRTKIEKICGKQSESQTVNCKITGGAGKLNGEFAKKGLKRHFFYHPIRVNKELLDEELPTPDTVRNARKLFEETLRLRQMKKDENSGNLPMAARSNENLRKKTLRYLTIDTSYGGAGTVGVGGVGVGGGNVNGDRIRKWDSSSMSSGISSGELSSPCECNEHDDQKGMFSSEENICGDDLCESYYVSQDILEKIRECGSSVTYYGGRVVDNKSPEISPMTKAIMREIRGQNRICGVCQPHNCPHADKIFPKLHEAESTVKFKLVKSNSCSSRLELAGTSLDEQRENLIAKLHNRPSQLEDAEESVRTLVNRLETGAIGQKMVPRIIESKCIEKFIDTSKHHQHQNDQLSSIFINNQRIDGQDKGCSLHQQQPQRMDPVDIITQVTVNNHINFNASPPKPNQSNEPTRSNKMARNRNVDLAFNLNKKSNNENVLEKENLNNTTTCLIKNAKNLLNHQTIETAADIKTPPEAAAPNPKTKVNKTDNVSTMDAEEQSINQQMMPPRLVKWNTLSKFDEKNYVANDAKLKQKAKYDEIEFEEFEVFDPNNPNNECYDSLNSK